MNNRISVLAFSGSIRNDSTNQLILQLIGEIYKNSVDLTIYSGLHNLPHFDPGLKDEEVPIIVKDLREQISKSDAVIFCTPEYVFSLPAILKNAIEWTISTTVFSEKPVAIITASSLGEKAHESLKLIMKTIYATFTEECTLLISGARAKVNIDAELTDGPTKEGLRRVIDSVISTVRSKEEKVGS